MVLDFNFILVKINFYCPSTQRMSLHLRCFCLSYIVKMYFQGNISTYKNIHKWISESCYVWIEMILQSKNLISIRICFQVYNSLISINFAFKVIFDSTPCRVVSWQYYLVCSKLMKNTTRYIYDIDFMSRNLTNWKTNRNLHFEDGLKCFNNELIFIQCCQYIFVT